MFMASKLCSVAANFVIFPGKLECFFPDFVRCSCDSRRINVHGIQTMLSCSKFCYFSRKIGVFFP